MQMYNPSHPGALIADILENSELNIGNTVAALARHIGVTRAALSRVIHGKAAVSAQMALRLEAALGVKADFWLRMQVQRDLWEASQEKQFPITSVISQKAA